jgi:hypothetical protein
MKCRGRIDADPLGFFPLLHKDSGKTKTRDFRGFLFFILGFCPGKIH